MLTFAILRHCIYIFLKNNLFTVLSNKNLFYKQNFHKKVKIKADEYQSIVFTFKHFI